MWKLRAAAVAATVVCAAIALTVTSMGSAAPAVAAAGAPAATTGSSSSVTLSSATVTGTVNPGGNDTHYHFEYGLTNSYGANTASTDAGAGSADVHATAGLSGLAPGTTYHYRIVATSSAGTTNGSDQAFTTSATPTTSSSQAVILGREGFVSPGRIVGVELGCFHGTATCTGHLTMSHGATVIAQRNYSIRADHGGFQNMELTPAGMNMLHGNRVFHLLGVTVTATQSNGQKLSFVIHLARWIWH
jgi:hypothetical protein